MIKHSIAYVSRHIYPDPTAAALQTIQMAAGFANQGMRTCLFVRDLDRPEDQIRKHYGVGNSPLRIWSLNMKRWPKFLYKNAKARFLINNSTVALLLGLHPSWRLASQQRKVVFVRSRLELLYWGLLKPYLWWLRDWVFIYEAHDLVLDITGDNEKRRVRTRNALANFDLVICVTRALAEDISVLTEGTAKPVVLSNATGTPRLPYPPKRRLKREPDGIVLGYVGTVDRKRGVDQMIAALRFLPDWVSMRVVGRIKANGEATNPPWLSELLDDPAIAKKIEFYPPVPYAEVAALIDDCDIALQPAGLNVQTSRHAAPLKLFDYMARGKPIVAARVPSHMELLQDRMNARLYESDDPEDLAECIMSLVEQPRQAEAIARKAWENSAAHTYDVRATRILELVEEVWKRRQNRDSK